MITNNRPTIKDRIEKEFGSINKFVDANYTKLGISRTYLYSLLNKEECNPTINILIKLSILTKIPVEEIFDEYSMRYRNGQPSDRHDN
jgi:DNA-binding XRE family transcriptional regulator